MKQEATQTVREIKGHLTTPLPVAPSSLTYVAESTHHRAHLGARHQFTENPCSVLHLHPRRSPAYPPTQVASEAQVCLGAPVWTVGSGAEWAGPGETVCLRPEGAVPGPPAPAVASAPSAQNQSPPPTAGNTGHGLRLSFSR